VLSESTELACQTSPAYQRYSSEMPDKTIRFLQINPAYQRYSSEKSDKSIRIVRQIQRVSYIHVECQTNPAYQLYSSGESEMSPEYQTVLFVFVRPNQKIIYIVSEISDVFRLERQTKSYNQLNSAWRFLRKASEELVKTV